ncbi:unnamed protein product [Ectocarpus sp. 12 AP-2014]
MYISRSVSIQGPRVSDGSSRSIGVNFITALSPAVPRAIYWNARGCIQVPQEDSRQPLRSTKSCAPLTRDPPVVVGVKKSRTVQLIAPLVLCGNFDFWWQDLTPGE